MEKYTVKLTESEFNPVKHTDWEIYNNRHVDTKTVKRSRKRCVEEGLENALSRKKHSRTKPRKLDG